MRSFRMACSFIRHWFLDLKLLNSIPLSPSLIMRLTTSGLSTSSPTLQVKKDCIPLVSLATLGVMSQFEGKVAVVTGAGRGIGLEIARAFASKGAKVAVISRNEGSCGTAAKSINEQYPEASRSYAVDVSDYDAVAEVAKAVQADLGAPNILVNNAGVTRDGLMLRMKSEDWSDVLDTNLKGAFHMVKAFQKPLMKAEDARIINIASVIGLIGNAGQANYAASKAGLIGFTKSIARELAGRAVTANAIAPGFIKTDMTDALPEQVIKDILAKIPLKEFGNVEDVTSLVTFLASKEARYITGQVLAVDGGMTMQ